MEMLFVNLLVQLLVTLTQSTGMYATNIHCFECQRIPRLQDCGTVTTCSRHEVCYVEQVVTSSGRIVFNSGCRDTMACNGGLLLGKREVGFPFRRESEIPTCDQCCSESYCNNEGCGEIATSRPYRGPYCFSCSPQKTTQDCRHVEQCSLQQVCFIQKLLNTNEELFESKCKEKIQCSAVQENTRTNRRSICLNCCDQDFCNVQCT